MVEVELAKNVPHGALPDPTIVRETLIAIASSGLTAGVLTLIKTWVDARNGRKLKIKVGDVEVDATQMKEKDVLRILELLQEKADRKKIRDALLEGSKQPPLESR